MPLFKKGSPRKIEVVKNANFTLNVNFLAEMVLKQIPSKKLTVDELHSALKSIGVDNYQSDDMAILMERLKSVGFTITK